MFCSYCAAPILLSQIFSSKHLRIIATNTGILWVVWEYEWYESHFLVTEGCGGCEEVTVKNRNKKRIGNRASAGGRRFNFRAFMWCYFKYGEMSFRMRKYIYVLFNSPINFHFISSKSSVGEFPSPPKLSFLPFISYLIAALNACESPRLFFFWNIELPRPCLSIIRQVVGTFADFWRWEIRTAHAIDICTCSHLKSPRVGIIFALIKPGFSPTRPWDFGRLCLLAGRSAAFQCLQQVINRRQLIPVFPYC